MAETYALVLPGIVIWGSARDIAPHHNEDLPLYELSQSALAKIEAARGDPQKVRAIITYEGEVYSGFDFS